MWWDKSLHKLPTAVELQILLKLESVGVSRGEVISHRIGKCDGKRRRGLTYDAHGAGEQGGVGLNPERIVCKCYLSVQVIQISGNEFEEQKHRGPETGSIQMTCMVYPLEGKNALLPLTWYFHTYFIFSWL